MVNFLLAIFLYIIVSYTWGEKYVPMENLKYGVVADSIGYDLGIRNGDKILALDDEKVDRWTSIPHDLLIFEPQVMRVERDGKVIEIDIDESILPRILKSEAPLVIPRFPFDIYGVIEGLPADSAGILPGDKVIALNGEPIQFYDEFQTFLAKQAHFAFTMTVERESETIDISLASNEAGLIGIRAHLDDFYYFEAVELKYGILEAIPAGIKKGWETTQSYLKSLKMLFSPKKYEAHKSLGGFIKIASFFTPTWDWHHFWNFTAFLSIMLAIMNLLPIPALDGGHVMFLLFEMVSGRKPGDKFMEYAQIVGMVLLLSLLAYANMNDIIGLFKH